MNLIRWVQLLIQVLAELLCAPAEVPIAHKEGAKVLIGPAASAMMLESCVRCDDWSPAMDCLHVM